MKTPMTLGMERESCKKMGVILSRKILLHVRRSSILSNVSLGGVQVTWLQAGGQKREKFGWDHRREQEASSNPILE